MKTESTKTDRKSVKKDRKAQVVNRNKSRFVLLICMLVVCISAGLVYVWSAGKVTALGYEISAIQKEISVAYDFNRKLKVELSSLKNPKRVARYAVNKLGMIRPSANRVVVLK